MTGGAGGVLAADHGRVPGVAGRACRSDADASQRVDDLAQKPLRDRMFDGKAGLHRFRLIHHALEVACLRAGFGQAVDFFVEFMDQFERFGIDRVPLP